MGFLIPGDATEQCLDLNQHLIHNSATTFFIEVVGDLQSYGETQAGNQSFYEIISCKHFQSFSAFSFC
jgi:hypothetical protein